MRAIEINEALREINEEECINLLEYDWALLTKGFEKLTVFQCVAGVENNDVKLALLDILDKLSNFHFEEEYDYKQFNLAIRKLQDLYGNAEKYNINHILGRDKNQNTNTFVTPIDNGSDLPF